MVYLNPQGHNYGSENLDGYGISQASFVAIYSLFFYATCAYVWLNRDHPILRMRRINLTILSLFILHVYLIMIFLVYMINGAFPCGVEFWTMSIYLPLGIGLFQAQNQQLLIVSQEQNHLVQSDDFYKPLAPNHRSVGGVKHCFLRLKIWWRGISRLGRYDGLVSVGICMQLTVSLIIYCLSRKFNSYGLISHPVTREQCRRGWEWLPSIIWQFLWNFCFGPYLIWKIRMIRDIYHWRLQTILAIIAGIPGTPLWLAAIYSDSFGFINKYWVPSMWFVPGLMTMEITALVFPITQIHKHNSAARETSRALADFDTKRLKSIEASVDGSGSITTRSTGSRRSGKMYSMESLDECLRTNFDGLQMYASCMELNGENIVFLVRVLDFHKQWAFVFSQSTDALRARMMMFRVALSIFVSLVHNGTAAYPINVESNIYTSLDAMFGIATELVASKRRKSIHSSPSAKVTPWEEPTETTHDSGTEHIQMKPMMSTPPIRTSDSNDSSEHIMGITGAANPLDPLTNFSVPVAFDMHVFDAAFSSIKYMVWTETWQRYMQWNRAKETNI